MAYSAAYTVTIGTPTKAADLNAATANTDYLQGLGDIDHDFHVSTGTGRHNGTVHFDAALATHGTLALMWWEDSAGGLWLLGKTNETGTFLRAAAEFYLETKGIADVPAS